MKNNDARAGFIHNRAVAIHKTYRITAALSGAGTINGVRIHIGRACRQGFLPASGGLDNSHYLPGGVEADVFPHTDAYGRLQTVLKTGQWNPPSAWHTRERRVSAHELPPKWVEGKNGLVVPMYETPRSGVGRDAVYELLTSGEAQERDYNRTADKNEEGNLELQSDPGLKAAFSESLSRVQMLAKGPTSAAEQSYWALQEASNFYSFALSRTRRRLTEKDKKLKHSGLNKEKLEEECESLSEHVKALEHQSKKAEKDPVAYFRSAETDRVATEMGKAESSAAKVDQKPPAAT